MAFSDVRSFVEPGEYAAAMPGELAELNILGPGQFAGTITHIQLPSLGMQRFTENLPRLLHATNTDGRTVIAFHNEPGPSVFRGGMEFTSNDIVRVARHRSHFNRSFGPISMGSISVPTEVIYEAGMTAAECDLRSPPNDMIVTPSPAALTKLRRLHAGVGLLAETVPELIENPSTARGLEQGLLEATVDCLVGQSGRGPTLGQRHHSKILRRFRAVLEAHANQPLYVLEMAAEVGVSLRLLSVCCQEHLGMGPKRYLILRRMNLARQALSMAEPQRTTVTEVATQYGFWQFGRFAGEYRALFGELPSCTLHRQPG